MAVFSSYRTSLATWRRAGILSRETRYLRLLSDQLGKTALITYDGTDRQYPDTNGVCLITGKPRIVPAALYSVFAPVIHWRLLRRTALFRTNQLRGAWTAAIASMLHRKPLVVRTGYVWSRFNQAERANRANRARKTGGLRSRLILALERLALRRASLVITASEADRDLLMELHGVPAKKMRVVPNPVDTDLFLPRSERPVRPCLVTYIGRLEPQKGVDMLIDAVSQAPGAELRVVGDGSLRAKLEEQASGMAVEFTGAVPNERLPELMAETAVFVLPSLFEGTPKALLEAMACGVAVVATRVPGTDGIVADGETGMVVEPNAEAIASAITALLADDGLRNRLGAAARRYVEARHSMLGAAEQEAGLIRSVSGNRTLAASPPPGNPPKQDEAGDVQHPNANRAA